MPSRSTCAATATAAGRPAGPIDRFVRGLRGIAATFTRPAVLAGVSLGGITGLVAEGEGPPFLAALVLVDVTPKVQFAGVEKIRRFMGAHAEEGFASVEAAAEAVAAYLSHRGRPTSLCGLRKNLRLHPDGTVYATNSAILNAVGSTVTVTVARTGSGIGSVASSPGGIACGAACDAQFPAGLATILNAVPEVGSVFTGWLGACTGLGPCQLTPLIDSTVSATFAPDTVAPLRVDIDGNSTYDALTDGLIAIRYLFGLSGSSLTAGALGEEATRTDPTQLLNHLNDIRPVFDVDGNGQVDALTDELMLIRYLFGLRGPSLIVGAIGAGATRTTAQDIETYIQSLMP